MLSVGRAAEAIILEVRRQFTETPELKTVLHGKIYKNKNGEVCAKDDEGAEEFQPDYSKCIAISTDASIMEMLIPGLMAVFMPVIIGFLLTSKVGRHVAPFVWFHASVTIAMLERLG